MAEIPASEAAPAVKIAPLSTSQSASTAPPTANNGTPPPQSFGMPQLSASTEQILQRVAARNGGFDPGTPGYEAAKQQVLQNMRISDSIRVAGTVSPLNAAAAVTPARSGGRGGRRGSAAIKLESGASPAVSTPGSGRGRGSARGSGRGRVRGRGGRRKSGKRKRGSDEEGGDEDDDDDSDTSNDYTPLPTTTKSGRTVSKPTTYVPTIASPSTAQPNNNKRRKTGGRYPSAASKCKTCQRGHSPQGNQIVFCDSCNAGYHQYCHHPPIEKDVVMVLDKEWICGKCIREKDREKGGPVLDVPKSTAGQKYFSGERWTGDEKRRYFESLPHSVAVELLLRSAVLYPTIPIFPSIPGLYKAPVTNGVIMNGTNEPTDVGAEVVDVNPAVEFFDDDPPAHYPKPGFGLARTLPPESEHLSFMVDENTSVFSHFFPTEEAGATQPAQVVASIAVN